MKNDNTVTILFRERNHNQKNGISVQTTSFFCQKFYKKENARSWETSQE